MTERRASRSATRFSFDVIVRSRQSLEEEENKEDTTHISLSIHAEEMSEIENM